jgi:diguanylate cyclase (GGDEF)-like protein
MNRSAERRQYKRFWVLQPAVLKNSMGELFQCEINDFCNRGILLSLTDANAYSRAVTALQDSPVVVEFRPDLPGMDMHRLTGRVVRVSKNTLGIVVDDFSETTFRDLVRVAQKSASANQQNAVSTHPQHEIDTAKARCHEHFVVFINQVIQHFYAHVDHSLILTANLTKDYMESRVIHTLFPILCERRAEIEQPFLRASYLRQLFDQNPASSDQPKSGSLSLVDIGEFEDWLNLSQAINELKFEHQFAIENFEIRYKVLETDATTEHDNPYGPYYIFQTFRKALTDIKLNNAVRTTLYKVFGESLSQFFDPFYQNLNETVAFVPLSRNRKTNPEPSRRNTHQSDNTAIIPPDHGQFPESDPDSGNRYAPPDTSNSEQQEYKLDSLLQYLGNFQSGFKPSVYPSIVGGQPAQTTAPLPRAGSLIPAMNSLFNAAQNIHEYGLQSGTRPSSNTHFIEDGNNLKRILEVLDNVRLGQDGTAKQNDHVSIRHRLSTEFPQLDDKANNRDKYFQSIQLFDSLLSKPLTEDKQGSDIRNLLKKLEMPLLRLALLDNKFLESDAHPARHTVNLFERYYVAADDAGKIFDLKLLNLMHQLADRVIENFEASPAVFDEVNVILANLLKPVENIRQKNVRRIQLISEGGEKIYQVRDQVEQEICSHYGGKKVPKIILVLLDTGWRHYLQLTSLREGSDCAEHQRALSLLDDLLELLVQGIADTGSNSKRILSLTAYVSEKLKDTLFDEAAVEEITQNLLMHLQGKTPIEFQFYADQLDTADKQHQENTETHSLRKGDWLDFEQQGVSVPHQLIWSNISQSRFVFTNRSATKKRQFEQHDLALAIINGSATKIPSLDTPFMERTAHKVMLDAYERIYHQATHDPETGLLNRKGLMNQIEKSIASGILENQRDILCLMMFDQLKAIYQSCDQAEAEASLLVMVASLSKELQPGDLFSRLGEDTFAVMFRGRTQDDAYTAAQNMISRIKEHRITCQNKSFVLGVSAGIAELTADIDSSSTLMRKAGSACVAAKSMGANTAQRYETSSSQIKSDQALFEWAGIIDKALDEDLLYLRCQKIHPIVSANGALPHYEILLGLDESLGIQPFDFIRAAERWKRSPDLDLWVVRNSFKWIRENAAQLGSLNGFSINLSGLSLVNDNVLNFIREALDKNDLPTEKIIFEVTESAAIERLDAAQDFIEKIKAYGCRFSLDDFGSGYSSFAYLKNLKVNYLKIDGAFVRDMLKDPADLAMVKSMHEVGHSLGLLTIAEYVENDAILAKLGEIGIDYAQGYGIGKPLPLLQLFSA